MKARIPGLDGLRGLAAVAVVFCHTVAGSTQIGGYAVNLFFGLSGFLILNILYEARLLIERGGPSYLDSLVLFWQRRILRICPAYYLVAAIVLTLLVAAGTLPAGYVPYFVTYTQNYLLAFKGEWLPFGYTWTLAVEQQFYVVFAALMLLVPAHYHVRVLYMVAAAMFALVVLLLACGVSGFIVYRMPMIGFMLASIGGALAIGGLRMPAFAQRFKPQLALAIGVCVVLLSLLPSSFFASRPVLSMMQIGFEALTLPLLIALVAASPDAPMVQVLEGRIFKFFGAVSYSLYLIHGELAAFMKSWWPHIAVGPHAVSFAIERLSLFLAVLTISTLLAWANYEWVEKTFTRFGRSPVKAT